MAVNNPRVTLEEAYWWLNNFDAKFLHPPLYEMLARFAEAEKANDRQAVERICLQFVGSELNNLRSPIKEMVENLHNAVKIWNARDIETARKKLNDSGGSHLRNPIYSYVLKMREAVIQDPGSAWVSIERLYTMSGKIADDREAGETLVECGWAAYKLQNRVRALQLFEDANRRYNSYMHQIAVVYWMIGFVYWELSEQNKALVAWRNCVTRFEKLASQRIIQSGDDTKWYQEVLGRLNTSIQSVVETEMSRRTIAAAPVGTEMETTPPTSRLVEKQAEVQAKIPVTGVTAVPEEEPGITFMGDLLEALPVLAEVPAGPWKQTRGDPNIIGQVEIGQVLIDNEPYFIKNLRGGHIISLSSVGKHVVVKITGDSMNDTQPTPIEDGDYVLLRRQNTAQAGDIVVAKIYDEATRGPLTTIKRFLIDGHPLLKAESNDPNYGRLDEEFQIDGLAVAVFKPAHKKGVSDTKPA